MMRDSRQRCDMMRERMRDGLLGRKTLIRTDAPLVRSAARHANPLLTARQAETPKWRGRTEGEDENSPAAPIGRPLSGNGPNPVPKQPRKSALFYGLPNACGLAARFCAAHPTPSL